MTTEINMRRFVMYRRAVPDETHDENQKNPPDEPQFGRSEGVRPTQEHMDIGGNRGH